MSAFNTDISAKSCRKSGGDRHMYETTRALFSGKAEKEPNAFPPPFVDTPPFEYPGCPVVDIDIEYVEGVVQFNSFTTDSGEALYAMPSLLNHSCLPTAHRQFLGDAFLLRAITDMKQVDEVTIGVHQCFIHPLRREAVSTAEVLEVRLHLQSLRSRIRRRIFGKGDSEIADEGDGRQTSLIS